MGLFQSFNISASGMTAQQFRADIIAENIANLNTTRAEDGETYRRKIVQFEERGVSTFEKYLSESKRRGSHIGNGVKVTAVGEDT